MHNVHINATCVKSMNATSAEKGNTTTFEYTYGEVPALLIEPPLNIEADEDETSNDKTNTEDANVYEYLSSVSLAVREHKLCSKSYC